MAAEDEIVIIRKDADSGLIPGLLLGLLAGAAIGLLRAPAKGTETRQRFLGGMTSKVSSLRDRSDEETQPVAPEAPGL